MTEHFLLPVISDQSDKSRPCIHCGQICIDEEEPEWKTACGDCFLAKILPTRPSVELSKTILNSMTLEELGELPMTWGKKYNGIKLADVPLTYWNFLTGNPYFRPGKHLHIYKYIVKRFSPQKDISS